MGVSGGASIRVRCHRRNFQQWGTAREVSRASRRNIVISTFDSVDSIATIIFGDFWTGCGVTRGQSTRL